MVRDKIDVIIPAYNCHSTIDRCLNSIAMQTIVKDIEVTIVDDCSPNGGYEYLIDRYKDLLKINIIKLEKNSGPGVARQVGYERTNNPLMTFVDADDTFADCYALDALRESIYRDYDHIAAAWGIFMEEGENKAFVKHDPAPIWMFGKLYKRSFWQKYGICFHPTSRYNEDFGVNVLVQLFSNPEEQIYHLNRVVYYWMYGWSTITRAQGDYDLYWDNNCLLGYAENAERSYNYLLEKQPNNPNIASTILDSMMLIWLYYMRALNHKAKKIKIVINNIESFYDNCYSKVENQFSDALLIQRFDKCVKMVGRVMPTMSFQDFLKKVREKTLINDVTYEVGEETYI